MELKYYDEHLSNLLNGKDFCEEVFNVVNCTNVGKVFFQNFINESKKRESIDTIEYFMDCLLPTTKHLIYEYLRWKLKKELYGTVDRCMLIVHLEHFMKFAYFLKSKVQ